MDITNVLSSVLVGATGLGGVWLGHALSARDAERARRDSARDRARSLLSDLIRNARRWADMQLVLAPGWAAFDTDDHIAFLDTDSGRELRQVVDALHSAFGQARLEIGNGPLQEPLKWAQALFVAAPDQMMEPLLDQSVDKTTRVREAWSYLRNFETKVDALESAAADLLSVSLST